MNVAGTAATSDAPAVAHRAGRSPALAGLAVVLFAFCGLLTVLILAGELGPVGFAVGLTLAVVPMPIYLVLGLWIDRYEPEPPRLLAWAFFWGATGATLVALIVNSFGQAVVGGAFGRAVGEIYGASLSAPVIEEVAKAGVLYAIYRWRRHEFDGVLDGIVYAGMVGLGFAFTENVLYYGRTALAGDGTLAATLFVRGVLSPFAHPVFTSLTGVGLGVAALRAGAGWRSAPLVGLFGAMVLHSLWNTSAGLGGGSGFLGVYVLVMVPVFLSLLAVVIAAMVRERHVIRQYLAPEVASGVLSPGDVEVLSSLQERRRALRLARGRGGRAALRARKELHHTAIELAFLRRHRARRPHQDAARLAALETGYVERLGQLGGAASLGPAAPTDQPASPAPASPTAAPARAPLPPAAWYPDPYGRARWRWWDGTHWTEHEAA
jgi:protease PrsW